MLSARGVLVAVAAAAAVSAVLLLAGCGEQERDVTCNELVSVAPSQSSTVASDSVKFKWDPKAASSWFKCGCKWAHMDPKWTVDEH